MTTHTPHVGDAEPPPAEEPPAASPRGWSRRGFLGSSAALVAAGALGTVGSGLAGSVVPAGADEIGPTVGAARADAARKVRVDAADFQRAFPLPAHPDNADETRYADHWGNYTKALQHNPDGTVVSAEYDKMLTALRSGLYADFEKLTILPGRRKLVDPLAAYAYVFEGADSHAFAIPPAPAAASTQTQGEMAELYWMALARDIPFDNYQFDGDVIPAAIKDLGQKFSTPPNVGAPITVQSLFRDVPTDSRVGGFVSQYLLQTVPYGAQQIIQVNRRRPAGEDQLTTFDSWLAVQQGVSPTPLAPQDGFHYLRNGRDLAEWVHGDFPAQAVLNAARIIAAQGNDGDAKVSPRINDAANPYQNSKSMSAFVTFGNQAFLDLVTRVSQLALQAAWYQKWLVHRRARPEEHGGRVEATLRRGQSYPIGGELLGSLGDSSRLGRVFNRWGSYLLPSTFVEGSPTHPAYPSGHSTFVAAGATMIKAFVDGTLPVENPVKVADPNNGDTITSLAANLTINGEVDKLVMNIGMGRLFAGVHWRSDHIYGVRLGELVAIRALQDLARTYAEPFVGWDLRRFDGTTVRITATSVTQNGTAVATTNQVV